ncbi:hypothetical protein Vqi01_37890 [Micromonospora qiuiae]|uniref:Uncharacterized protein n=1 Tax=Micromonospora qiuiae TaxID=502268 RepID=A0ABQ4JEN1_9ACTN|nr:hypothetical protein [Micromonospora qiuiae]GIJ28627.1 hypothetical protein Vqi01_37890 [Micromonospora qiuiae]
MPMLRRLAWLSLAVIALLIGYGAPRSVMWRGRAIEQVGPWRRVGTFEPWNVCWSYS